jgi:hypothetical protein
VTPRTDIVTLGADATATPFSVVCKPSPSRAASATFHTTPGTHLRANNNFVVAPPSSATAELDVETAAAFAAATAALLAASPGTALAADILASALCRAPQDLRDTTGGGAAGDDVLVQKEQLYSRFSAAATPGADKASGSRAVAKTPATAAASGATKRKAKSTSPTSTGAVRGEAEKVSFQSSPKRGAGTGASTEPPTGAPDVSALYAVLLPPAKKRKARRWLTSDQKTNVCGIGGCVRAYGSASSLCAHKRAHHPGWKEARKKQQALEAEAAAAADPTIGTIDETAVVADADEEGNREDDDEEEEEEEEEGDADADVAGRAARREGAAALDTATRATPSGAWVEALAADTHGRLGALRRSRQRVQRGLRDARAASAKHPPPVAGCANVLGGSAKSAAAAAESIAAAAAARLLQQMDAALESEAERLREWLGRLEGIAELRMGVGRVIGVTRKELEAAAEDHAEAARIAQQTANAIAAAAVVGEQYPPHSLQSKQIAAVLHSRRQHGGGRAPDHGALSSEVSLGGGGSEVGCGVGGKGG